MEKFFHLFARIPGKISEDFSYFSEGHFFLLFVVVKEKGFCFCSFPLKCFPIQPERLGLASGGWLGGGEAVNEWQKLDRCVVDAVG